MKAIVACSLNRGIGKDNKLLFDLPEDLQHFSRVTKDSIIVMGRKTFESLPHVLPGRRHFVLTRDLSYTVDHPQVDVFYEFDLLLELLLELEENETPFYIIGGAAIYRLFTPYIDEFLVTHVPVSVRADTYLDFPLKDLYAIERTYYRKHTRRPQAFEIVRYVRDKNLASTVSVFYK